ncbi:MAG: hypothetical protein RI897_3768 [Verrucomicrobiota bacterium]
MVLFWVGSVASGFARAVLLPDVCGIGGRFFLSGGRRGGFRMAWGDTELSSWGRVRDDGGDWSLG